MPSGLLADLVMVAHLGFIAFATFGALCTLRWAWAPAAHLPTLAWAAYVELTSSVCPLTPLEHSLRVGSGEDGYSTSFIEHHLAPIIYPTGLGSGTQLALAIALLLLNALLYAFVVRRRVRIARLAV